MAAEGRALPTLHEYLGQLSKRVSASVPDGDIRWSASESFTAARKALFDAADALKHQATKYAIVRGETGARAASVQAKAALDAALQQPCDALVAACARCAPSSPRHSNPQQPWQQPCQVGGRGSGRWRGRSWWT